MEETLNEQVDFVNPVFIWLSSIDTNGEGIPRRPAAKRFASTSAISPTGGSSSIMTSSLTTTAIGQAPSSPFLKAKTALKRTFSSTNYREINEKRIRQAQDACIWLKSAGFPQYVQKFERGEFPINVTSLQVEKDHQFLDTPSIEALVKRLNVLNRCADLLEEVLSKQEDDYSDDDETDTMRALSEQWQFQKDNKKWSRKTKNTQHNNGRRHVVSPLNISTISDSINLDQSSSEVLMVSELSTSPTRNRHQGTIKTYSFCGDKFVTSPSNCVASPDEGERITVIEPTLERIEKVVEKEEEGEECYHDDDKINNYNNIIIDNFDEEEEGRIENLDRMGSFATTMLSQFDANLSKLRHPIRNELSRSLPNVFNCNREEEEEGGVTVGSSDCELDVTHTCLSSLTGSTNSLLCRQEEDSDSIIRSSPIIHSRRTSAGANGTWVNGDLPSPGVSLDEESFIGTRTGRRSTMESTDSSSLMEQVEVFGDNQRKQASPLPIRAKWHSFQRQHSFRHAFKPLRTMIPIEELSVGQITVLRKLSLVKLTALIELHNGKTNVSRILKSRRHKTYIPGANKLFGSSLSNNVIAFGQAIPPIILQVMEYLKRTGMETVGIFRRTAAKARVEYLKELIENSPEMIDFSEFTSYELADLVKLFFRELPESIIPSKLSEALLVSYECIPGAVRFQAQQSIMLLLPDENREALQCLLHFLSYISQHSLTHQMDAQNLGLCLAPSLFSLSTTTPSYSRSHQLVRRGSLRRPHSLVASSHTHSPHLMASGNKELNDHVVSSRCLAELITSQEQLFKVAADMMQLCKFSHLEFGDPVPFQELGLDRQGTGGYRMYVDNCMTTLAKEQRRRYRGWIHTDLVKGVSLAYCKVGDGVPLRLWRGTVEVPAPPELVLRKLWEERFLWDGQVIKGRTIVSLDDNTEVFQYVTSLMTPQTNRDHCILRSWKFDPSNECYVVVATSVSHPNATLLSGVRCTELAMRYLIEPTGPNSSNLMLFCRVDMRGRSAEYYNHFYGRYLASSVSKLKDSFSRSLELEYLETPV